MPEPKRTKPWWKKMVVPILVILLLGSVAATAYLYREMQMLKDDSDAVAEAEVVDLIAKVGELIVLPSDELPTVATVADPDKLRNQAFFANAKEGDRVLLYTNAKKAILYDPVAHKIVEVAPINLGAEAETSPEPTVAGDTTETPTTP